ncbi:MAG: cytochrome c family protein [Flavobacteriaceae bacterium]|nr:cytochrome c family protein [Flavobacteriaceae bacterium]
MLQSHFKHIIFFFLVSTVFGYGQISPGDLTQSHADLEGMSNCTLCHDIGEKVSNNKCLDCHKDIQSLLNQNKGYHASSKIVKQDCFECHSDHHGRKFDMIRFDEDNFDHNLAGYSLDGKHKEIDCKECHKPDYIADNKIKKRENTFLGLDEKCLSCHDDFHQQTLTDDCLSCHNMDAFKPVIDFDHELTDYPLTGEHITVDCIECHEITTKNGKDFQNFSNIPFNDCVACHDDPHNDNLPGDCNKCHTESSFSTLIGKGQFKHNLAGFELKSSHNAIDCFSCHVETSNPLTVFQDKTNIDETNCISCHNDTHEGKYGLDCAKCHNERSFLTLNNMDFFDHDVTDYSLEGKHLEVDCKECHKERYSVPINFTACNNCHVDYHQGEFIKNNISPDCVECHTLENGFEYSLYALDDHQSSSFPLEGAHVATPCFACHVSEEDERWTFAKLGSDCIDCHQDIHESQISTTYYDNNNCTNCHINDAWNLVTFDHELTDWPLSGKHNEVNCRECHIEYSDNETIISQNFINLDTQCISCHENIHGDLFVIDNVTDCNRCHVTTSWLPEKFDHSITKFPLVGVHSTINCKACHEVLDESGKKEIIYKLEKFECIDCHL